jgi:hypothetical protein
MFGPAKILSKNRLCGPISIERISESENFESSSYAMTATKSAINCQSMQSLQSSGIESKHCYFNFGAPQFPRTASVQPWFLCPPWHDLPLYIHTTEEYSFQPQSSFRVNIVVVRFIINVWFNGVWFLVVRLNSVRFNGVRFKRVWFNVVRFTRYYSQNQNVSKNLWPSC